MEKLNLNLICDTCNKKVSKIFKCGKCKNARYCSRECQIKDWSEHKENCLEFNSKIPTLKYVNKLMDVEWIKGFLAIFGAALNKTNKDGKLLGLAVTVVEKCNINVNSDSSLIFLHCIVFDDKFKEQAEIKEHCKPTLIQYLINKEVGNKIQFFHHEDNLSNFMYHKGDENTNFEELQKQARLDANNTIFKNEGFTFDDFEEGKTFVALKNGKMRFNSENGLGKVFYQEMMKVLHSNKTNIISIDKKKFKSNY